jgi:hypothetical protein
MMAFSLGYRCLVWYSVPYRYRRTIQSMGIRQIKSSVAVVWVLAAIVIGLIAGVTSPGGLVALAALGLLPPLALLLLWNDPSQSMSESIQQGRR